MAMGGSTGAVTIITVIIAVSIALLAWFAVEVGTQAISAYRTKFTERAQFQVQEFFLFIFACRFDQVKKLNKAALFFVSINHAHMSLSTKRRLN